MTTKIKQKLESRELRQRDLAIAVDIGEGHLNRIIKGEVKPSVELAMKIATALDATVEELFGKE